MSNLFKIFITIIHYKLVNKISYVLWIQNYLIESLKKSSWKCELNDDPTIIPPGIRENKPKATKYTEQHPATPVFAILAKVVGISFKRLMIDEFQCRTMYNWFVIQAFKYAITQNQH